MKASGHAGPPAASPAFLRFFASYARVYVGRHFHSLRVLRDALPPAEVSRPTVIFLNHASWWDPLVCLLLAREFFPGQNAFAPIESAMLQRYGFFRRLGFFGIEPGTARGARTLLRVSRSVLNSPGSILWITPQGRFVDPRSRTLSLQSGLGAIAAREPHAAIVPLAIEYPFWTEPRPEILAAFGPAIIPADRHSPEDWTSTFTAALHATQDRLAERAKQRDPVDWNLLNRGQTGISLFYDAWRRLRAKLHGETFVAEHSPGGIR